MATANVVLSTLEPSDEQSLAQAGEVGYEAFRRFSLSVGQPPEFQSAAEYRGLLEATMKLKDCFALKATIADSGRLVGSVIMHCLDPVAAIGPISSLDTLAVEANGDASHHHANVKGVGRRLMEACVQHAYAHGFQSVRLVQIVSNVRSFSLYHKLGFDPREYLIEVRGTLNADRFAEFDRGVIGSAKRSVRQLMPHDLAACDQLHVGNERRLAYCIVASFHSSAGR